LAASSIADTSVSCLSIVFMCPTPVLVETHMTRAPNSRCAGPHWSSTSTAQLTQEQSVVIQVREREASKLTLT
jgi:hypothetical protein